MSKIGVRKREAGGRGVMRYSLALSRVQRRVLVATVSIAALAVVFVPSLSSHMRQSANPGVFNDDVRQHVAPFFRYEDPALFPNDYVVGYFLRLLPIGFRGLYWIGAHVGGVESLSKVLPYFLLFVTSAAMALAARRFAGATGAFAAVSLWLGSNIFLSSATGGLPRSFGFPLIACALLALCYGRVRNLALLSWIGAAFYPPPAVCIALSLGGMLLVLPARDRGEAERWSLYRRIGFLSITAAVMLLVLLPPIVGCLRYGRMISPADYGEFPEAGPNGRSADAPDGRAHFAPAFDQGEEILERLLPGAGEPWCTSARRWLINDPSGARMAIARAILLGTSALGWVSLALSRSDARRVLVIPAAATLAYGLADLLFPRIHFPERYVEFSVPLLATLMLSVGIAGWVEPMRRIWDPPFLRELAVAGFSAITLLLFGGRGATTAGLTVTIDSQAPVYRFLRQLPTNAVIAGWPGELIANLPYVTRRSVLVSFETHVAVHTKFVVEMRRRMYALIEALYATSGQPIARLRNEFGVTHLLVDVDELGKPLKYFAPFDTAIRAAAGKASGKELEISRRLEAAVFRDGPLAVIDLGREPLSGSAPAP